MIVSDRPAAKVPAALKMLVRYVPISGMFIRTPGQRGQDERGDEYPDVIFGGDGIAGHEAEQDQEQSRVRDLHESADDRDGKRHPANDLEWIHLLSP